MMSRARRLCGAAGAGGALYEFAADAGCAAAAEPGTADVCVRSGELTAPGAWALAAPGICTASIGAPQRVQNRSPSDTNAPQLSQNMLASHRALPRSQPS